MKLLLALFGSIALLSHAIAGDKPNILVIFTDDHAQGSADLEVQSIELRGPDGKAQMWRFDRNP